ncbi:MAG: glycosyltransferase [Bacillota bacterium]
MKLLFVAQNLQMGGIQKALINTIKELNSKKEYEIDIFSFGKGNLMEDVPDNVNIYTGNLLLELVSTPFSEVKKRKKFSHLILRIFCMIIVRIIGSKKLYRLLFKNQQKLNEYDVAISYFNDVANGHFNKGTNLFVDEFARANMKFAWIHTDPIKAKFDYQTCLETYQNFDRLLCVSKAVKEKFDKFLPEYKHKTSVVYNFFPINDIQRMSKEYIPFQKGRIDIVSVGRIDNSTKRFDYIPQLCKLLKDSGIKDFKWRIVGDGPDLESNKRLVDELGVQGFVEFIGEYTNPYPFIKNSDLLILTSAYEGYPMVVGEALILRTPVITTKFAAANEQIKNGLNGMIIGETLDDLYYALKKILEEDIDMIIKMKKYIVENEYTNDSAQQQLAMELEVRDENYRE